MAYQVSLFAPTAEGLVPWGEPFPLRSEEYESYKQLAAETIETMYSAPEPPDGPRPEAMKIANETGEVVFEYVRPGS